MTTRRPSSPAPQPLDGDAAPSRFTLLMRRLGSWRFWIPSAVVFIVFAGVFFASSAPFSIPEVEAACGQAPPDVRPFTSAGGVSEFLDACGPRGRTAYRNMQIADLFYPAAFGLFLASSIALAITRISSSGRAVIGLAAVPLVAAGFDYLENAFAWIALVSHPGAAPTNALLGLASAAKTTIFWVSGILLLGSLGVVGVQRIRRTGDRPRRTRERADTNDPIATPA